MNQYIIASKILDKIILQILKAEEGKILQNN